MIKKLAFVASLALVAPAALGVENPKDLYEQTFTSDALFIVPYPGGGSCALDPTPKSGANMLEASLSERDYFKSSTCGMCVQVNATAAGPLATSQIVFVNDLCPRCKEGEIGIASLGAERQGVTWRAVECPVKNNEVQYKFSGDSRVYLKMQIRNTRLPVKEVSIRVDKEWKKMSRTTDNYFTFSRAQGFSFPLDTRVLFIDDIAETHTLPKRGSDGQVVDANRQGDSSDSGSGGDGSDGDGSGDEGSNSGSTVNSSSVVEASTAMLMLMLLVVALFQ